MGLIDMAIFSASLLHRATIKRLIKQAQAIDEWLILSHTVEKHTFKPTQANVVDATNSGRLLEYHTESGTDRIVMSHDGRHWVLDLDDHKLVTSYIPDTVMAKKLEMGQGRGLFSGKQHKIESTGKRRNWSKE